jgi:hypothetical protein
MAAKKPVSVSVTLPKHRPNSAERRAAQLASISNKQAELKQEAADRRAQRDAQSASV